jgi:hypothetical protein
MRCCNLQTTIWLLAMIALCQCKTIRVSDLQPRQALINPLPRLLPVFSAYPVPLDFAVAPFWVTDIDSAVRQPILLPPVLDSAENRGIRSSYYQDRNASELEVYFARDIQRNYCAANGDVKGYASCVITALEERDNFIPFLLLHTATLYSGALLGVPTANYWVEMEVEVVIKDLNNQAIGVYRAVGKKRLTKGFYYGYRFIHLERAATLFAFKSALADIKKQIEADSQRLNRSLGG